MGDGRSRTPNSAGGVLQGEGYFGRVGGEVWTLMGDGDGRGLGGSVASSPGATRTVRL